MVREEISIMLNTKYVSEKTQGNQGNKKVRGARDEIEHLMSKYVFTHCEPAKPSFRIPTKDEISFLVRKYIA